MKYLDNTGLAHFWTKVKSAIGSLDTTLRTLITDIDTGTNERITRVQVNLESAITKTQSNIANVEDGTESEGSHSTGDLIMHNDELYAVTIDIDEGDTITAGLNVENTTVNEQLTLKANNEKPKLVLPRLYWGLGDNDEMAGYPRVELRRTGNPDNYGVGLARYDSNNDLSIVTLFDSAGNFLPQYVKVVRIFEADVYSSSMVADKATATLTGTIVLPSGASNYFFFPMWVNFGCYTSGVELTSSTLSVSAMNISGASHTLAGRVLVIAVE